jgi:hypothetical protein
MIANNHRLTERRRLRNGPRDRQVYGFQCDTLFMDVFNGLSLSHIRSRRRSLSFVSLGRQEQCHE